MFSKFLSLFDNSKLIYTISFLLLAISVNTSWRLNMANFIGFLFFINQIRKVNRVFTVYKICIFLMITPIISIIILALLSFVWKAVVMDTIFIISFSFIFIGTWIFAAVYFDKDKVKAAMTIINAFFASILVLTFLANFINYNSYSYIITTANQTGISSATLIESLIKYLTFPYVLAGIWGAVIIELRHLKIINVDIKHI